MIAMLFFFGLDVIGSSFACLNRFRLMGVKEISHRKIAFIVSLEIKYTSKIWTLDAFNQILKV
jgi:hypothetical protein